MVPSGVPADTGRCISSGRKDREKGQKKKLKKQWPQTFKACCKPLTDSSKNLRINKKIHACTHHGLPDADRVPKAREND